MLRGSKLYSVHCPGDGHRGSGIAPHHAGPEDGGILEVPNSPKGNRPMTRHPVKTKTNDPQTKSVEIKPTIRGGEAHKET